MGPVLAMTLSKDIAATSRPSLHRQPVAHSRNNSHYMPASSIIDTNSRISRRKSMTSAAHKPATIAAALSGGETASGVAISAHVRRPPSTRLDPNAAVTAHAAVASSMPTCLHAPSSGGPRRPGEIHLHAKDSPPPGPYMGLLDEPQIPILDPMPHGQQQSARLARASSRIELRCEKCGKEYKHSSCLTKHLWEHTPEWSITSKLLISKHQQVQLLEAASVLVSMNNSKDEAVPPGSAKDLNSDSDSYSPMASGFSDQRDNLSSADTTPPPQPDPSVWYSAFGSVPSPTSSYFANSVPHGSGFGPGRRESHRPISSGRNHTGKDDRELAAAVELLSCSHGDPEGALYAARVPENAPLVPSLPTLYLDDFSKSWAGNNGFASLPSRQPESFARGERIGLATAEEEADTLMYNDDNEDHDDDEDDLASRSRDDEEDDGTFGMVFGRMEE